MSHQPVSVCSPRAASNKLFAFSDNVATPLAASLGDLTALALLSYFSNLLFYTIGNALHVQQQSVNARVFDRYLNLVMRGGDCPLLGTHPGLVLDCVSKPIHSICAVHGLGARYRCNGHLVHRRLHS